MLQNDRTREKDQSDGVPVPVVDIAAAEVRRGRLCALALWLPVALALSGCGGGSAAPGVHVAGAVRAWTSYGPVDVIVVRPEVQR